MANVPDVVFLIPGFLGFERFEDFSYFADRVSAGLRAALSERFERVVPVVPLPIPPTGSLKARQQALAATLVARTRALEDMYGCRISRIHLLGHSTGGVDAQLLTLERPLGKSLTWSDLEGEAAGFASLRTRVRSVISVASPHYGTCLADDDLARLLASPNVRIAAQRGVGAADEVGRAVLALAKGVPTLVRDDDARELLINVLRAKSSLSFLWKLRSRTLIDDLSPEKSWGRYAAQGESLPILRRSFVTIAGVTPSVEKNAPEAALAAKRRSEPPPGAPSEGGRPRIEAPFSPPDALFLFLSQLTAGKVDSPVDANALEPSRRRIEAALRDPALCIVNRPELLPMHIDAASNDGIVNTIRQLIDPQSSEELASVVVADHFDVVGHYDKELWVVDPETGKEHLAAKRSGLLHSGSEFRDDQFFELMRRVVNAMSPAFA